MLSTLLRKSSVLYYYKSVSVVLKELLTGIVVLRMIT